MKLVKDGAYQRKERKFFKKHPNLIDRYAEVLSRLKTDPFEPSLKMHKLHGDLSAFHACSLTHEFGLVCLLLIQDESIVLVDIGSHDEVY